MKIIFPKNKFKLKLNLSKKLKRVLKIIFWFLTGALLSFFFVSSFGILTYQKLYENKIYPGVYINDINFGAKTREDVKDFFTYKNSLTEDSALVFTSDYGIATISARQLALGYDQNLSADQAFSIGRSDNLLSNISLLLQANLTGINLSPSYSYNQDKLLELLKPIYENINKNPVDALFKFENNRVSAFIPSENGRAVDTDLLHKDILTKASLILPSQKSQTIIISIPISIIEPNITTDKANNLGIKELIGQGHSTFYHSIPGRAYNVNLATSKINGALIKPGETFSFNKTLGDVSAFTGYKQAYIIQNGKTVLGDGGGVCQVSTTFFRALLDAGLPIIERSAHAYRVGYYEQDSPPGLDATIFVPSVDLKFKNDTGNYILVQSEINLDNYTMAFYLYGTKDGRISEMSKPLITSQSPPLPDVYQDDPTLPKGETRQTDFAAWGANVFFTRTVTKNNKIIITDKFTSNYRPWQAIYLRGTKE